jgi:hypothetical protein
MEVGGSDGNKGSECDEGSGCAARVSGSGREVIGLGNGGIETGDD